MAGTPLTFTTDGNTEFNDGATLATMANTVVTVEGITRSDGTLYAKEVEGVENVGDAEVEGLILQVIGNPATQLTFVVADGSGSGMDDTKTGSSFTADVSGAQYKVAKGNINTSGIGGLPSPPNFPFDASTVHAGQRIELESVSSLSGNSLVAEKVKLIQQTVGDGFRAFGNGTHDVHAHRGFRFGIRDALGFHHRNCLLAARDRRQQLTPRARKRRRCSGTGAVVLHRQRVQHDCASDHALTKKGQGALSRRVARPAAGLATRIVSCFGPLNRFAHSD
jgi:Domain of unknown function (DUF5666)